MAITINQEPQDYNPAYNPCVFTFSSTNTAQPSFAFAVALLINGVVYNTYTQFALNGTSGKFDATEPLRAFLRSNFPPTNEVSEYSGARLNYSIAVQEMYGEPPILQGTPVVSSTINAINGSLRHLDWMKYNHADFDLFQTDGAKFLTDFPRDEKRFCKMGSHSFLSIFNTDGASGVRVKFTLLEADGTFIESAFIVKNGIKFFTIDCSPESIIANTFLTLADFELAHHYTVTILRQTAFPTNQGEFFRFDLKEPCSKFQKTKVHFLNKYGVWDDFVFNKLKDENTNINSSDVAFAKGRWDGVDFNFSPMDGFLKTAHKEALDTMTLNSDYMSESLYRWLVRNLLESPIVYMETSDGFEYIRVKNSKYKYNYKVNNPEIMLQLEVDRTYTYNSQLG